jgi:hypothetical protein
MGLRLSDLNASFVGCGGEGVSNADGSPAEERSGVAVAFDCPCGCEERVCIPFANPLDGKPLPGHMESPGFRQGWQRTGETLETLTLAPSIARVGGCAWHGFIRDGGIVNA